MNKLSCQLSSSVWPNIKDFNYFKWAEHMCGRFYIGFLWNNLPKVLFAWKTAFAISSNSASLSGFNILKVLITKNRLKTPMTMRDSLLFFYFGYLIWKTNIIETNPFLWISWQPHRSSMAVMCFSYKFTWSDGMICIRVMQSKIKSIFEIKLGRLILDDVVSN